jgi:hypothetical protein
MTWRKRIAWSILIGLPSVPFVGLPFYALFTREWEAGVIIFASYALIGTVLWAIHVVSDP